MLKVKVLEQNAMILTGSKVLSLIQDTHTPPVDLFVREVVQNSADAIRDDKSFGRVNFIYNDFKILDLISLLGNIDKEKLEEEYKKK
jgi:hypothetical protein